MSANGSQCSAITDTKNPTCGCTCNINFTLDVDFSVIKLNLVKRNFINYDSSCIGNLDETGLNFKCSRQRSFITGEKELEGPWSQ